MVVGRRRRGGELLRFEVSPVIMLEVGGAVAEQRGEANAVPPVEASKDVVLDALQNQAAPPADASPMALIQV